MNITNNMSYINRLLAVLDLENLLLNIASFNIAYVGHLKCF